MNKKVMQSFVTVALAVGMSAVHAQNATPQTGPMDHSQMDHGQMGQGAAGRDKGADTDSTDHGGTPPDEAATAPRDPHAYSGGYDLGPLKLQLADEHSIGSLLVDNLESVRSDDNTSAAYDLQAWYGRTYDRAVLKAEGEVDGGELEEARTELLWSHAIAPFWDAQAGGRYDGGEGPGRGWIAFGVQGLAPYWFEVEAFGYVGEEGRSAVRLDASYELLLTQRAILQPRVEANFYGKEDAARGLGSGLSDIVAGLRLRYEIRREFAPYIGVEAVEKFGETADFVRVAGEETRNTRWVAGLRFWF